VKSYQICELLPIYEAKIGEISQPYDCEGGNTAVSIVGTTLAEFSAYVSAISATNAKLYAKNEIAGNHFATFLVTDAEGVEYAVHLMYYPIRGNARVVWGKKGFLPVQDDAVFASGNHRTSVLQYARNGVWNSQPATGAPGMANIITLADGSFILIDGGPRQREQHFTKAFVDGEWVDAAPARSTTVTSSTACSASERPRVKSPWWQLGSSPTDTATTSTLQATFCANTRTRWRCALPHTISPIP